MISAGFAILQPEAFAVKVDRAAPLRRDAGAGEPFSASLGRQSRSTELAPPSESTPAEDAPRAAQDSTDDAQPTSHEPERSESDDVSSASDSADSVAGDEDVASNPEAVDIDSQGEAPTNAAAPNAASIPLNESPQSQTELTPKHAANAGTSTSTQSAAVPGPEQPSAQAVAFTPGSENAGRSANESTSSVLGEAPLTAAAPTSVDAAEDSADAVTTAPTSDRRIQSNQADHDVANSAIQPDESVEPVKTARVNPVDAASSSADANSHAGEPRQSVESLVRGTSQTSQAPARADSTGENRVFEAQVSRGLEAALRQNGGSVTIRLKPETLGALKIDLQIAHGSVAARLEASTPEARELLNKHMATLRTALEAKGFSVRSIEVQVPSAPSGGEANAEFNRSFSGQSQSHSQDAHAGANGHASGRREDPGGDPWNNQTFDPLAEDELIEPGWRSVYVNGSLNAVA